MSTYPAQGTVLADQNAQPTEELSARRDANSAAGVVVDANTTPRDDRGPVDNSAAEALIDAYVPESEAEWLGDRVGAETANVPQSVYLSPALDLTDPAGLGPNYGDEPADLPLEP